MPKEKERPTMEHRHTAYGQYMGQHFQVHDPRPNPRTRRAMSAEDDPAKARYVEEILRKMMRGDYPFTKEEG